MEMREEYFGIAFILVPFLLPIVIALIAAYFLEKSRHLDKKLRIASEISEQAPSEMDKFLFTQMAFLD